MNWSDIAAHITGLAHIATADADGVPHAALVTVVVEGDVLWMLTRQSSRKGRNLAENPHISIMWHPGAEVYVQGDVQLITALEEKQRIWGSGLLPYDPAMFFGTPENPDMVLVRITPVRALIMTMGERGPQEQRWARG